MLFSGWCGSARCGRKMYKSWNKKIIFLGSTKRQWSRWGLPGRCIGPSMWTLCDQQKIVLWSAKIVIESTKCVLWSVANCHLISYQIYNVICVMYHMNAWFVNDESLTNNYHFLKKVTTAEGTSSKWRKMINIHKCAMWVTKNEHFLKKVSWGPILVMNKEHFFQGLASHC